MASKMRLRIAGARWLRAALAAGMLATLLAACSVFLNHDKDQCSNDGDCAAYGGNTTCQAHLCVASTLGPVGCYSGTPSTPEQFANQCSSVTCESFDNCDRLGLCTAGQAAPPAVPPGRPDAGVSADAGVTADAAEPPALPPCVDPGRLTVVVGGSTAVQGLLAKVAPLLAAGSPPYALAYQPSGSCTGVDNLFDLGKQVVKDLPGKQALLFDATGKSTACTFGSGTKLDVAVSDVYGNSCNAAYNVPARLAEYLGPIQPMTFVVKATSTQTAISAEMAHVVFGRGNTDTQAQPYIDPSLYFVRNASSGTQQMIARAIGVDAKQWWGLDQGGSSKVRDVLEAVDSRVESSAIGILSTDFADPERSRLRILAFKGERQTCAYYPDATLFSRDKINVRDGHYSIWGPVHFYAEVSGGVPNAAAAALVTQFTLPRLDQGLLDAIIDIGFVPPCAMKVKRDTEMGPLSTFSPEFQCGCYFASRVPGGAAPDSCKTCAGPADCPSATPACNNGYCEVK